MQSLIFYSKISRRLFLSDSGSALRNAGAAPVVATTVDQAAAEKQSVGTSFTSQGGEGKGEGVGEEGQKGQDGDAGGGGGEDGPSAHGAEEEACSSPRSLASYEGQTVLVGFGRNRFGRCG